MAGVSLREAVVARVGAATLCNLRIDVYMLRPVPEHQRHGCDRHRHHEHPERRGRGNERAEHRHRSEVEGRAADGKGCEPGLPALDRVIRQLYPRTNHEAEQVVQPVQQAVALVRLRRTEVPRHDVVLFVMHDDVMQVVHSGRHAHERRHNVL